MSMSKETERELLQIVVGFCAAIPFIAGLRGVIIATPTDFALAHPDFDSHYVYLSGVFAGLGIAFWRCVRHIERRTEMFRTLCGAVLLGGLCRLVSWVAIGNPSWITYTAMVMEIVITPSLALWQMRIARLYGTLPVKVKKPSGVSKKDI